MADVVIDTENRNPNELLALGVKAYVLQDYEASVAALSKASELLVLEHKDDLHDSLGIVYLHYGKALLGLSRDPSNVLGDAVPKGNEDSEEDGEESESEENSDDVDGETEKVAGEAAEKEQTGENPGKKDETTGESSDNVDEKGESTDVKTEENEDEASDLQLAWEVLELAKKIYERQGESGKKHLAETFIILGEISLESENFSAAIDDITQGLEIQKTLFESDSRIVAETYYKLGIAYATDSQIDKAVESFLNSLQYLKNRVTNLDKIEDKKDEIVEEIKEINGLIPDIEEKIADMKTYKDEESRRSLQELLSSSSGASSSKTSDKVNDISHLVKKKRKLDDVEEKEEKVLNPPKKPAK